METPAFVLDSPVVLALLKGDRLGKHIADEFLGASSYAPIVPVVVVADLWATALSHSWKQSNWDALDTLLDQFDISTIDDDEVAEAFAIIKAATRHRKNRLSDHDLWLAATAHVYGAVLLTSDIDFQGIPQDFCQRIVLDLS